MPLFGEIVIPSSRILWDDDDDLLPQESQNVNLEWDSEVNTSTLKLQKLIIVETSKLTALAKTCLIPAKSVTYAKLLPTKVKMYLSKNCMFVLIEEEDNIKAGALVEKLIPFITVSEGIYAFTSAASCTYQTILNIEKPSCFIRCLKTGNIPKLHASQLEAPNLITGVASGVISYCHYSSLPASIYICYLEPRALDSVSAEPILKIFDQLQIPILNKYKTKKNTTDNNLYM